MRQDDTSPTDRRTFLQAGAVAAASGLAAAPAANAQDAAPKPIELKMRSVPLSVPNGKLCVHYRPQDLIECAESPPVRQLHLRFTIRGMVSAVVIIGLCCALAELLYDRFGNTVYANHYSEQQFRSLGIGMTTNDVEEIMGAPIRKDSWGDSGDELWRYSESVNDGDYWRRWIFFRNGRVCRIDCQYWID